MGNKEKGLKTYNIVNKRQLEVDGLTTQDILNMSQYELARLENLRQVASRLVSSANKRIKRLLKIEYGESSPALIGISGRSEMKFSIRGKTEEQILDEINAIKSFFRSRTSTTKGFKEYSESINKRLNLNSDWMRKRYWKMYRETLEASGFRDPNAVLGEGGSDRIQKLLRQIMKKNRKNSEVYQVAMEEYERIYQEYRKNKEEIEKEMENNGELFFNQ